MIRSSSSLPSAEANEVHSEGNLVPSEVTEVPSKVTGSSAGVDQVISPDPLDIVALLSSAHHPAAGAVVLFSGEVRDHNKGRDVAYLEYEAYHPLATKMINEILREATEKWGLRQAIARHRVGRLSIGESAVVVITAAAHRREAYEANQHIIHRIKHEVPIWKCEHFSDGTHQWGNNCNC